MNISVPWILWEGDCFKLTTLWAGVTPRPSSIDLRVKGAVRSLQFPIPTQPLFWLWKPLTKKLVAETWAPQNHGISRLLCQSSMMSLWHLRIWTLPPATSNINPHQTESGFSWEGRTRLKHVLSEFCFPLIKIEWMSLHGTYQPS